MNLYRYENLTLYARVEAVAGWQDDNLGNNELGKSIMVEVQKLQNDLALSYLLPSNPCPQAGESLTIFTQLANRGDYALDSGVPVKLFAGDPDDGGVLISTQETTAPLAPSESQNFAFSWTPYDEGRKLLCAVIELPVAVTGDKNMVNNQLTAAIDVGLEPDYNPPAYIGAAIANHNQVISVIFDKELLNNLPSYYELAQAVQFSNDGISFRSLGENDAITINGCSLLLSLAQALEGDKNKIRIAGNSLKSINGNVLEDDIETDSIIAGSEQPPDNCFIATAAFGSKFTWPVTLLRQFRDQYLLSNSWGSSLVNFYYRHSPPIAAAIAGSQPLKMLVRVLLAPVIGLVYTIYHPFLLLALMLIFIFIVSFMYCSRQRINE